MRALRQRRGWRQIDLAGAAGCSQNLVSLVERGHLDLLSTRVLRRLAAALDATLGLEIRWRGASLDRLLDEGHAALVAAVAESLRGLGWLVAIEVTYSEFGERGSFDLIAFHPVAKVLLVVEVKTDLPSAEATLRKLDEKARLATRVARDRLGWQPTAVARVLVVPESATLRRRIARHQVLFGRVLPQRNVAIRRWLAHPAGTMSGLWFLSLRDRRVGISGRRTRERVRRPKSTVTNPPVGIR